LPECVTEPSSDGILRILTCSNIVPVKRVELIAKVIAELPGEVEWTHIGDGDGIDSIKSYVEAVFDHSHRANFVGRLANAEVYEYYQNHLVDLFMNLSESEGVPVSIMEALVHGVPVVATDVGGTAEIVDETIGCVLPIDVSARDACEAVLKLGLGTESSIRLRENARARGEERCSSQSNYSVFCGELSE
jgi:glycosyltransferase involved in cell wall biosynthesis